MTDPHRRAVLDTNVLISALLVTELTRALEYPKLKIPPDAAHTFAALVVSLAEPDGLVPIAGRLNILTRDPADNAVLETALVGKAAFLVTGNPKHFAELPGERPEHDRRGVHILGPREFLKALV